MFCVGLTGGVGSGKSTVTAIFASLDVPILDADTMVRTLTAPGQPALHQIVQHFGSSILDQHQYLDRQALREVIFNHPEERSWLEQLLHPLVIAEIRRQKSQLIAPYCIVSAPLLMEAQVERTLVDRVLVIDVDPDVQIARTRVRDHLSETQVRKMMRAQCSREKRLAKADDVIENNADIDTLRFQIEALHRRYLALSRDC